MSTLTKTETSVNRNAEPIDLTLPPRPLSPKLGEKSALQSQDFLAYAVKHFREVTTRHGSIHPNQLQDLIKRWNVANNQKQVVLDPLEFKNQKDGPNSISLGRICELFTRSFLGPQQLQTINSLPRRQQFQLVQVAAAIDREGRGDLAAALIGKRASARLENLTRFSKEGTATALEHLVDWSRHKTSTEFANKRLISSVLTDVMIPSHVRQQQYRTCAVASTQYMFCAECPAEYARIMKDLATTGRARLPNGEVCEANRGSLKHRRGDARSESEAVFQSTLLDFANGKSPYSYARDGTLASATPRHRAHYVAGVEPAWQKHMLNALFPEASWKYREADSANVGLILEKISVRAASGKLTRVDLRWGGGHGLVIVATGVDARGTRFFDAYNPNAKSLEVVGAHLQGPSRTVVRREGAQYERFTEEEFSKRLIAAYLPAR